MNLAINKALPWAAAALGLLIAALAGAYAVETALAPSGQAGGPLPLPLAYDAAAARTLVADPVKARTLALRALALRPSDARAWLIVAAADARAAGALTPEALQALEHSYDVAPYDPELTADRVAFSYQYWSSLPPELKEQTLSHVRAVWPYPDQQRRLAEATQKVADPRGKLALAMELFRLNVVGLAAPPPPAAPTAPTP